MGRIIKDNIIYSYSDAGDINYNNTNSELASTDVQGAIDELNSNIIASTAVSNFTIETTDWDNNTDPGTSTSYPYVATVSTSQYTEDSAPLWQMGTTGLVPLMSDMEEISKVQETYFDSLGVKLYATDLPSITLVLQVKGV